MIILSVAKYKYLMENEAGDADKLTANRNWQLNNSYSYN